MAGAARRATSRTCPLLRGRAGGENGFSQAIELSAETLSNVKFVQEKRLITSFFDQISQDTGRYVSGISDTLACLEMGAVETLVVWENLEAQRYEFSNSAGETEVKILTKEQETNPRFFKDRTTGHDLEVVNKEPLLEWIANNYKKFGCALEFVTNRSQEGSQFCKGFGGIGGLLRYAVNTTEFEEPDEFAADSDVGDGEFTSDEDI